MSDLTSNSVSSVNLDTLSTILSAESVDILGLLVASGALLVSIFAFIVSYRAYKLSDLGFREERRIILIRDNDNNDNNELKLKPLDSTHHFSAGTLFFPQYISEKPYQIGSDGHTKGYLSLEVDIKKFLKSKVEYKENSLTIFDANFPVNIKSLYSAKSSTYKDMSTYVLTIQCIANSNKKDDILIKYTNLTLLTRRAFKEEQLNMNVDNMAFVFNNQI